MQEDTDMKISGQELKVTLSIHGREKTFSEQELIAILEKHFSNEVAEQAVTVTVAQRPTEEQWFEVNPQTIEQRLFLRKRKDKWQEETRKLILEAFAEVENNPEKYGRKFKTMMPRKTWLYKTVEELKLMACLVGDRNANWVEQALEWAQRIYNGESWETVCNNVDTANFYRLVMWKTGFARLVGGSRADGNDYPASGVHCDDFGSSASFCNAVPLVVLYEK